MFVQKVARPGSRVESWTVLGDDDAPVAAIESYLSYLSDIERSPNTVKAYAHDLKDYFVFLAHHGREWREVRLEDVGEFVAWLRLPPVGRSGQVAVLPSLEPHVGAATINRKLSAVSSFYEQRVRRRRRQAALLQPAHIKLGVAIAMAKPDGARQLASRAMRSAATAWPGSLAPSAAAADRARGREHFGGSA
jgi:hypothetical protein